MVIIPARWGLLAAYSGSAGKCGQRQEAKALAMAASWCRYRLDDLCLYDDGPDDRGPDAALERSRSAFLVDHAGYSRLLTGYFMSIARNLHHPPVLFGIAANERA